MLPYPRDPAVVGDRVVLPWRLWVRKVPIASDNQKLKEPREAAVVL